MESNNFLYFEQILEAIYKGEFNEMMRHWTMGTDCAIVNYLYKTKCSIKELVSYFGLEENFIKERIKYIAQYYDKMYEIESQKSNYKKSR